MGVGLNSAVATASVLGVSASKIGTAISSPNDGEKNKKMAAKAKKNKEAVIKARKEQINNTLKKNEAALKGQNKDPKTVVQAKELMRDR